MKLKSIIDNLTSVNFILMNRYSLCCDNCVWYYLMGMVYVSDLSNWDFNIKPF